jgi:predicted nucleic acid-binding protein
MHNVVVRKSRIDIPCPALYNEIKWNKMKVYLDNCVYNRPFDDQSQIRISLEAQAKLYIQRLIVDKKIELVYSYMSVYENSENPNTEQQESISCFFHNAVEFVDPSRADSIEVHAEEVKKWNIKANDAIHIACAIEGKCDCFITTDDGILKKYLASDIRIYNPIDFILETEIFISHLLREPFDYTEWQKKHYSDISVQELNRKAVEYAKRQGC